MSLVFLICTHADCKYAQIRLLDGTVLREQFKASATIAELHAFIAKRVGHHNFHLVVPGMPKKEYNVSEHGTLTLLAAGTHICSINYVCADAFLAELAPRGSVNVLLSENRGHVLLGTGGVAAPAPADSEEEGEDELHAHPHGAHGHGGHGHGHGAPALPAGGQRLGGGATLGHGPATHAPAPAPAEPSFEELLEKEEKMDISASKP